MRILYIGTTLVFYYLITFLLFFYLFYVYLYGILTKKKEKNYLGEGVTRVKIINKHKINKHDFQPTTATISSHNPPHDFQPKIRSQPATAAAVAHE